MITQTRRNAARGLRRAEIAVERFARRRLRTCLVVGFAALALRISLAGVLPIPVPSVHDEFSYVLGGETFARGRLANPPHPMWRFFETVHVNMQPTYASKYPPGQALFLALGIRAFGHPWFGVWLSTGVLCGCICWMLQGWLPARYALAGGLLAALQLAGGGYWVDSYWGGAVAAAGGALVMGAIPRLARKPAAGAAAAAALGVAILANSRPFEGLALVLISICALVWWAYRLGNLRGLFGAAVLVPATAGMIATFAAMAYYNARVTGDPLRLPYSVNAERYRWAPSFWMQPPGPPPESFRDASIRKLWEWDYAAYHRARRNPGWVAFSLISAMSVTFVQGPALPFSILLLVGIFVPVARAARVAAAMLSAFVCVVLAEKALWAHYLAPAAGLYFLTIMFGLQSLRAMKDGARPTGLYLAAALCMLSPAFFAARAMEQVNQVRRTAPPFRSRVTEQLNRQPGRHLVMVHYSSDHNCHDELVYNGPDIDQEKIVWALDRGAAENPVLLRYFADRTVWLAQPDGSTPALTPYEPSRSAAR